MTALGDRSARTCPPRPGRGHGTPATARLSLPRGRRRRLAQRTPRREHRCGAVAPPAPLAAEKQRQLCLRPTPDLRHVRGAQERRDRSATPARRDGEPRPMARTTPLVLDPAGCRCRADPHAADRSDRPGRADRPDGRRLRRVVVLARSWPPAAAGRVSGSHRRSRSPAPPSASPHAASAEPVASAARRPPSPRPTGRTHPRHPDRRRQPTTLQGQVAATR